jgi:hypothetical protein
VGDSGSDDEQDTAAVDQVRDEMVDRLGNFFDMSLGRCKNARLTIDLTIWYWSAEATFAKAVDLVKRLVKHSDQWGNVTLRGIPSSCLSKLELRGRLFPCLRYLSIDAHSYEVAEFHKAFSGATHIRELKMVNCGFSNIPQSPQIKTLWLRKLSVYVSYRLLPMLAECPALEVLEATFPFPSDFNFLTPIPVTLNVLKTLVVHGCVGRPTFANFIHSLNTPALTRLEICQVQILEFSPYNDLVQRSHCTLRELEISCIFTAGPIRIASAESLLQFLQSQTEVTHLSINRPPISVADFGRFTFAHSATMMPQLSFLTLLNLDSFAFYIKFDVETLVMNILNSPSCFNAEGTLIQDLNVVVFNHKARAKFIEEMSPAIFATLAERRSTGVEIRFSFNDQAL